MEHLEIRSIHTPPTVEETRAGRVLAGYAAVFNRRAYVGAPAQGFWEQIAPGAFGKAVLEDDVRLLIDHDPKSILARTGSGTLRLSQDSRGLKVEADYPTEVSYARDLAVMLDRGDVSGMSFQFKQPRDKWSVADDGQELRTIHEARLVDVSVATIPVYQDTEVALRTLTAARMSAAEEAERHRATERLRLQHRAYQTYMRGGSYQTHSRG